ncbi:MAG: aminotransferase class I/II-fold pyridoxal phosphate-dependent enzyme [Clostridiales bacterium]
MVKSNTPIIDNLFKHLNNKRINFHVPGHKQGINIPKKLKNNLLKFDMTELSDLDNLHSPESIIYDSMELTSKTFKSDKSYFLINGTTVGIHAAIMSVCNPCEKIIIQRDCHKSVIGGILLAGAVPRYIIPSFEDFFSIPGSVNPNDIKELLSKEPDIKAVIVSNPNYYGICSNLKEIQKIVHSFGKILIVDEAHGSHFIFNNQLPISAMEVGADISIQSAHKTLPALTQSSFLHIREKYIDKDKLEYYLNILQTTSPSYLLMSFLEFSRNYMELKGTQKLSKIISNVSNLKNNLSTTTKFSILENTYYDKTRIVLNSRSIGITGFKISEILEKKYNIWPEMSDLFNVVFISSISNKFKDFNKLRKALINISKNTNIENIDFHNLNFNLKNVFSNFNIKIPISEIKYKEGIYIDFSNSENQINFNIITPYPPGIPLINPGEIITKNKLLYIKTVLMANGHITGLKNNNLIKVVKNNT